MPRGRSFDFSKDEMRELGLTEKQYALYNKLMKRTSIKNLPREFKDFFINETGFPVQSLEVSVDLGIEAFVNYVKANGGERKG